ncbi:geranylgeranyl reductase family protein [Corynebacterium freneyi]|uniref:Geranylgeranyl reductase family protein n=1 Tax=Corynebacterium freneyi TaxID=134034 RepID=A0ABS4UAU7_9CORY|nr:geranylgeranyl reductase family protein [Corynebacterium freneyi]MBP2333621.1 geranylgeranyl reductase family protein [Corynebacterium freneyi]QXA52360.1 geranylgeranyl reductase family protein [Corynebacterium freneyi]
MTAQSPIPQHIPSSADVVVVGAGPTGAAAAAHAADRGLDVLLIDAQTFPRDKTCGDGLTPRAIAELERLGLADEVLSRARNRGLKLHGFGGSITAPWPEGAFPAVGSAVPRTVFDAMVVDHAVSRGATLLDGTPVTSVERGPGRSVAAVSVRLDDGAQQRIATRWLLVADGVRSPVGKQLGRTWHRDSVFGVAARSYCTTTREEEWIHSHLELRDEDGTVQPGYGWIFPLGGGRVNLGCGALATSSRPAKVNVKKLLHHYAGQVRDEWGLGQPEAVTSALLPMGGAVSHIAGPNWALLGDAAALVNPLNGEGIDYGMESARLVVGLLRDVAGDPAGLTHSWPAMLRDHYGEAYSLARRLAAGLTVPWLLPAGGPLTLGAPWGDAVMGAAARLMGNLITPEDRDLTARVWRAAGKASLAVDSRPPWS